VFEGLREMLPPINSKQCKLYNYNTHFYFFKVNQKSAHGMENSIFYIIRYSSGSEKENKSIGKLFSLNIR